MTGLGTAVTAVTLTAAFTVGVLVTAAVAAAVHAFTFGRRLEEADNHARLARDAGYRAGLIEGMEAADRLATQRDTLIADLRQANVAFDECTGDYAKELVADESWRMVAT